jgi:hypothetical protein
MSEVTDFVDAELTAVNGLVFYFQSKRRFPSWTSPVRTRSPAPSNQQLRRNPKTDVTPFFAKAAVAIFCCVPLNELTPRPALTGAAVL